MHWSSGAGALIVIQNLQGIWHLFRITGTEDKELGISLSLQCNASGRTLLDKKSSWLFPASGRVVVGMLLQMTGALVLCISEYSVQSSVTLCRFVKQCVF